MPQSPPSPAYTIERELAPDGALLATDPAGRRVTLKRLDDDCLLDTQLHPVIRDRLSRIRELAHLGVANLLGVERIGEHAFMVWEYIDGRTLESVLEESAGDAPRRAGLARQLVRSIETMHTLGIVHGAIHPRNVIVTPAGSIKLTHVSPLLYNDESVDVEAVARIVDLLGEGWLSSCPAEAMTLRDISAAVEHHLRFGDAPTPPDESPDSETPDQQARSHRRVALVGAAMAALVGAAVAWGIWRIAHSDGSVP